ncbi:MAG: DUF4080 domain-containing protein [Bacillota bacterium]|nr:DUF4080 domain-containing protein [Bacillota bacterium]
MRILLFTLNSRFSHSNLALRYIRSFWMKEASRYPGVFVEMLEYSINSDLDYVLSRLQGRYDVIFASTYIWNVESYRILFHNLRPVDSARIVLGGPEVTYLDRMPDYADAVIRGEGEEAFVRFIDRAVSEGIDAALAETVALFDRRVIHKLKNIDVVPFPYDEAPPADAPHADVSATAAASTDHKTVYYEASRGCPYRCSYCLSSIDSGVRHLPLERVLREIDFFIEHAYRTVKLVDRTMNASSDRFLAIVSHILERDRGGTAFHFEINAERIREEDIALFARARRGLFKLEAGIQSTHEATIRSIDRRIDTARVIRNCKALLDRTEVDLHVDLIAGLPFETFERFLQSFDEVFAIRAQQFQLGFLKVLSGTPMAARAADYDMAVRINSPYEVLRTRWISYEELQKLKQIEKAMDRVNYQTMPHTLDFLIEVAGRPSALYLQLGSYFDAGGAFEGGFSTEQAYRRMNDWFAGLPADIGSVARALLRFDYALYGSATRPDWLDAGVEDSLKLRKRLLALPELLETLVGRLGEERAVALRSQVGAWRLERFPREIEDRIDHGNPRNRVTIDTLRLATAPALLPPSAEGERLHLIHPAERAVIRLLP